MFLTDVKLILRPLARSPIQLKPGLDMNFFTNDCVASSFLWIGAFQHEPVNWGRICG
jgi:hypothetical protein